MLLNSRRVGFEDDLRICNASASAWWVLLYCLLAVLMLAAAARATPFATHIGTVALTTPSGASASRRDVSGNVAPLTAALVSTI